MIHITLAPIRNYYNIDFEEISRKTLPAPLTRRMRILVEQNRYEKLSHLTNQYHIFFILKDQKSAQLYQLFYFGIYYSNE